MKAKKDNTKNYAVGGYVEAALGGVQAIYGMSQLPRARAEFEAARAAAPSLETPAQFYENYRNSYDAEIARMESESIDRNIATSVQALQGAGGRALVGGLGAVTGQAQSQRNQMLAQERNIRLQAGQQLALAEERSVGRKEARSQADMDRATQAYNAALGNIGAGVGSIGSGLTEALSGKKKKKDPEDDDKPDQEVPVGTDKEVEIKTPAVTQKGSMSPFTPLPSSPEMDFANNYSKIFRETPVPALTTEPKKGFGMQNFPAAKRQAMGMSADPGRYDELLGRSTNPNVMSVKYPSTPPPSESTRVQEYDQRKENLIDLGRGVQNMFSPSNILGTAAKMMFEQGGMMTEGSFNHNTNPIDLVQGGVKVGEATGGEYILNPKQAASIAKESSYAKKLFKRFEKNAKKKK
jgi:hypothetical protein